MEVYSVQLLLFFIVCIKFESALSALSKAEKTTFLNKHNALRRLEPATNMQTMVWDSSLERVARNYAGRCVFEHNSERTSEANVGSYVGENLYARSPSYDAGDVVQNWYDEKQYYTYDTNKCEGVCGHYTQVVWAGSSKLGCAVQFCSTLVRPNKTNMKNAHFVVCNYAPGGNVNRARPYIRGTVPKTSPKPTTQMVTNILRGGADNMGTRTSPSNSIFVFAVVTFIVYCEI